MKYASLRIKKKLTMFAWPEIEPGIDDAKWRLLRHVDNQKYFLKLTSPYLV